MFIAVATPAGWNLYRKGNSSLLATFSKLATITRMVESIRGGLKVYINGCEVN